MSERVTISKGQLIRDASIAGQSEEPQRQGHMRTEEESNWRTGAVGGSSG